MSRSQLGLAGGVRLSTRPDGTDESVVHRTNSSNDWVSAKSPRLGQASCAGWTPPSGQPLGGLFETWPAVESQNPAPAMRCRRLGGAMPLGSVDGEQRCCMSTNFGQLWMRGRGPPCWIEKAFRFLLY